MRRYLYVSTQGLITPLFEDIPPQEMDVTEFL